MGWYSGQRRTESGVWGASGDLVLVCSEAVLSIRQSDASRRGKKGLKSSRDKNEGMHRGGEGEEEPAY